MSKNKLRFVDSCGEVDVLGLFSRQFEHISSKSAFYQKKLKAAGIRTNQEDITLDELPFTTKQELLDDQEENGPFGSNLCVTPEQIQRVHRTSGTTRKPLVVALTRNDIQGIVSSGAVCARISGLTPSHRVVHCLNYCMWMGGYTDHQILEEAGATVIPFGVGNSKSLIETIQQLGINAISATPSYLNRLELVLKEEFDFAPKDLGLRLGLLGTESGLQDPNFRKKLEDTWGLKAMNSNYGLAEVWSIFGAEDENQDGLNFISNGYLYAEIINPETLEVLPIEKGVRGELVITHLKKESQPLIRYRTYDMIEILTSAGSSENVGAFKFNIVGRSDDMLVIKGLNVFPNQIRSLINRHLNVLTGIFEIILETPPPLEQLYLRLEYHADTSPLAIEKIHHNLIAEFKTNFFISPTIELVREGQIERQEGKSKYVRKLYEGGR